ncbi:MAG: carbonic anhydrase [Alphaproteobacteria bacterium]|nr:MAG: carbonic anhydrase [Alphaproteobacteria bacterium]
MHRRHALKLLAGLSVCPLCSRAGSAADPHWSYEGTGGPANWGDLDPTNRACAAGLQQSPLDIGDVIRAQLSPLRTIWDKRADTIVNNGHTIQLNMGETSVLGYGNTNYRLLQFHFHHPSEHLIAGKLFPMEVHFVHANAAGSLAVIGVLMAAGRANAAFNKIVSTMPDKEGPAIAADRAINPNALLPPSRSYYRYEGSLTTPPCSETVDWLVLTDPIQVADADITRFARLFPMNARPVQKSNRRFVLRSA